MIGDEGSCWCVTWGGRRASTQETVTPVWAPNFYFIYKFNDRKSLNRFDSANTTTANRHLPPSSLSPSNQILILVLHSGTRVWKQKKALLQSHPDKRSFIVYLWTVCTFSISDRRLISCNKNLYYLGNEWPWINNDVNKAFIPPPPHPPTVTELAECIKNHLAKNRLGLYKNWIFFTSSPVLKSILENKESASFESKCEMPQWYIVIF